MSQFFVKNRHEASQKNIQFRKWEGSVASWNEQEKVISVDT